MKSILITGGTKGIGLAVARALLPSAERMILTYGTDVARAEAVKAELESVHPHLKELIIVPSDIEAHGSASVLADKLADLGFVPDVVILNAGVTNRKSFWEIEEEDWIKVLQGNLLYNIMLIRHLGKIMPQGSCFVATGSLMGLHPHSVSIPYGVSKSSLHALVKNMVKELSPLGIRINGVIPGFIDTEWQKNKPLEVRRSIESKIALQRFASPEEIADIYKMLVETAYLNGELIVVDGGYSYR
ncbi:MAG: SDR family oxidoreductase [Porphyromonas sp.]|nr:SDR family oxidoreductase [Porphyromonas sp.]